MDKSCNCVIPNIRQTQNMRCCILEKLRQTVSIDEHVFDIEHEQCSAEKTPELDYFFVYSFIERKEVCQIFILLFSGCLCKDLVNISKFSERKNYRNINIFSCSVSLAVSIFHSQSKRCNPIRLPLAPSIPTTNWNCNFTHIK